MFDIGWTEIAIIALIALLVIGPKDLPQAMRTVSHWVKRIRGMAREFQSGVDDMIRDAELDGIKEEFSTVADSDLNAMVENTIDPDGTMAGEFNLGDDFVPPDDTSPAPRKKKAAKAATGAKRAAKTGAKSKRAAAAPAAGKPAAKKPASRKPAAKRTPAKQAAAIKTPPASSTRPPTTGLAGSPAGNKARS